MTIVYVCLAVGGGLALSGVFELVNRFPRVPILGPVLNSVFEEVTFRLPLLILFSSLTVSAWIGIVIGGLVFGAIHILPFDKRKTGFLKFAYILTAILATIFGLTVGWVVVSTQNFLYVILLHMAWNVFAGLALEPMVDRWRKRHKKTYA